MELINIFYSLNKYWNIWNHIMNIFSLTPWPNFIINIKWKKNQFCVKNVLSAFEKFILTFKGYNKKWMDHDFEELLRVLYRKTTFIGPPIFLCKSQILEEIEKSLCELRISVVAHPIFVMEKLNKNKMYFETHKLIT